MLKSGDLWMGDHLSDSALVQFHQGILTSSDVPLVDAHLFSCAQCQTRFQRLVLQSNSSNAPIVSIKQALKREDLDSPLPELAAFVAGYPDFETIAAYAEGTSSADEVREFEVLMARFPALEEQVEDLRALRRELNASADAAEQMSVPAMSVPPMIVQTAASSHDSSSTPSRKWLNRFFWALPSLGTAISVAALLFLVVISPLKNQLFQSQSGLKQQVAIAQSKEASGQAHLKQLENKAVKANQETARAQNQLSKVRQQLSATQGQSENKDIQIADLKNKIANLQQLPTSAPNPPPTVAPPSPPATPNQTPGDPVQVAIGNSQLPVRSAPRSRGNEPTNRAFFIQSPQRTKVRDLKPILRWANLPEATGYKVTLQDKTAKEVVFQDRPVSGAPWQVDEPLIPGHEYVWSVQAVANGKTLAQALVFPPSQVYFGVLSEAEEGALQKSLKNASPQQRIEILKKFNLVDDVQAEYDILKRTRPSTR